MDSAPSKAALARSLGVSRQSLYYQPRRPAKDEVLRERILATLKEHPAYGHRRIALTLQQNKKFILRVMRLYHIRPTIVRKGRYQRFQREITPTAIPSRLKDFCPIQPDAI